MNFYAFPAWSLSGSRASVIPATDKDASPGPVYDTSSTTNSAPTWKIGTSKRSTMEVLGVPGPSHYNPAPLHINPPKYSMPAEQRKDQVNENPGPGHHEVQYKLVKSKSSAHSMAYKYDSGLEDKRNHPGVGDYDITLKSTVASKKSIFGTSSRKSLGGDPAIPGPGQYEVRPKSTTQHRQTFGRAKRATIASLTPAPNSYNLKADIEQSLNRKKGYSISQKLGLKLYENQPISPGPGAYNVEASKEGDAPSFSVGKEKRQPISRKALPGPADYHYQQKYHVPNGNIPNSPAHVGFGKVEKTPGPGHYQDTQAQTTSFSIPRSKSLMTVRNSNPGPGEYAPIPGMANQATKSWRIGNSLRSNPVRKLKPGPGDYNVLGQQSSRYKGITIAKDERKGSHNDHPGPGHYALQSTISNLSRYATFQREFAQ